MRRRRALRPLLLCLGASVSLHAAVLVSLPWSAVDERPSGTGALEVLILQPEPLPVAYTEPKPQRRNLADPGRMPERAPPKLERQETEPVLALSESRSAEGSPFTVPAAQQELPQPAREEKPEEAGAVAALPSSRAAYLRNPAPRYPDAARRAGEQGTVTLRVLVSREGLPARVAVEKSSGSPYLDKAALEAVRGWRFAPARQGAERIESWMLVPVVFRLEGNS